MFDTGRPIGRNGVNLEFCSIMPGRVGDQYYFRAVTDSEYKGLITAGKFKIEDSYQGISPTEDYAAKYFGENKSHYLIEFKVGHGINLTDEFKYSGTGEKAESGVMLEKSVNVTT